MINRKRIREYISCPELGDDHYGRWGILTKEQTLAIYELLKILDSSDYVIENLQQENKELHNKIDKVIEYITRFDIQHLHEVMEHNLVEVLEVLLEILKDSDVDD